MASPSGNDVPLQDDVLADEQAVEEEGEGEDLFGDENFMNDYRERPELDNYDPAMLDDAEQEPLTMEQRRAAERAMAERDGQSRQNRRRQRDEPATPARRLAPSTPYTGSSDVDPLSPGSAELRPDKRRRQAETPGSAGDDHMSEGDVNEDDVPESYYNLDHEKLGSGETVDNRLEQKIRRNFQQFLLKFIADGQDEPKYPDLLRKMAEEHQRHLNVLFNDLQAWSAQLALWVVDRPTQMLPILNQTLMSEAERRFATYRQIAATDEKELRVAVSGFHVQEPIRELCIKHLNKLVNVQGVATKRSQVFNQVNRLWVRCAKCNFPSGPFDVVEERTFNPGSCVECQSKGPWKVDRQKTLYRNHQVITLQESPSSVEPGKMPRSKQVILTGDQVDSVRPGDDLSLTAIFRCIHDAATNARTCFPVYKTELEAVHVARRGDVKLSHIGDDRQQQILELAKTSRIRDRIIESMAPSIYGMRHVKTAIALSMFGGQSKLAAGKHRIRGDLNVLIVGDPGLAKSQFLKYVESTFPRAVYTTGKGASAVGLTAAVTRDERGDWVLEGGAMVLADEGICLIDEFDKMNDQDRTSIHEAMEQQTISISKAGIVATLQARCAVVAVANPREGRYNPQQTFADNVNLSDPILSRFDIMCVLKDESDAVQDERLADHVIASHIRSHPEASPDDKLVMPKAQQKKRTLQPLDQDLLQKYICYARQKVFPQSNEIDKEKVANFYKELRAESFRSGGAPVTARFLDSIMRLSEAFARMELRAQVNAGDLDLAIGVMLESFIQSQKHQVAEELRQKFRRYIAKTVSAVDQFMGVMDKIFSDKMEQLRIARRGGAPTVSEVSIDIAEIAQYLERHDLDLGDAQQYFSSPAFHENFRREGQKVFRVM